MPTSCLHNNTTQKTVALNTLVQWCNALLQTHLFKDYCPNGLQVEGKVEIKKIVCGVSASQSLIDAAIQAKADAIVVHHGYFWKGEAPELVSIKGKRIKSLMQHDMSLMAYHLPLDAHPTLGNNAALAQLLGLTILGELNALDKNPISILTECSTQTVTQFEQLLTSKLGQPIQTVLGGQHNIQRVGICTGAAQDYIAQAAQAGCDAFISGEISERTFYEAQELGIHYFACGHHRTEMGGIHNLMIAIRQQFGIEAEFIDTQNPA